jgi:protein-disulfide isomerase
VQDEAKVGVLVASALAAARRPALPPRRPRGDGTTPARPFALDPPVDPERDHIRGPADAPLTLVEYGDFECPFCGEATGAVAELRERYGPELRYVFRHLPLQDVHPHAALAAQAAEAAGAQDHFWEMFDILFAHQDDLELEDVERYADELGLDLERFSRDLVGARHVGRVEDDVRSAEASGVTGTPTFFVGDERHTGAHDALTLVAALEEHRAGSRAPEARP